MVEKDKEKREERVEGGKENGSGDEDDEAQGKRRTKADASCAVHLSFHLQFLRTGLGGWAGWRREPNPFGRLGLEGLPYRVWLVLPSALETLVP